MINLKHMILSFNQLKTLPKFIQVFQQLESLEVSSNCLEQLPVEINNLKNLKKINCAANEINQLTFNPPKLQELSIQMNRFHQIPHNFVLLLEHLNYLELDWFKYTKPSISMKQNFLKENAYKIKLMNLLNSSQDFVTFEQFVKYFSYNQINFTLTDYKYYFAHKVYRERNLYFLAGLNEEIGILKGLYQIIPDLINYCDFDNNTALSVCYGEGKFKSAKILIELGAIFSQNSIFQIIQRLDLENFKLILQQNKIEMDQKVFTLNDLSRLVNAAIYNFNSLLNKRNIDGNTPLHILFHNFQKNSQNAMAIAEILVQSGAHCNIKNKDLWTPLQLAIKKNQLPVNAIKWASYYNKKVFNIIESYQDDKQNFKFYKNSMFNFEKSGGNCRYRGVHLAANSGHLDVLQYLMDCNCNIFTYTTINHTPKNIALQSLTILKYLRLYERRWLSLNIIGKTEQPQYLEFSKDRNVQQMKNQIEKNMTKKQINMIQKIEEEIIYDIDNLPSSPKNEFSSNQENVSSGTESDFEKDIKERVFDINCSSHKGRFNSLPQMQNIQPGSKNSNFKNPYPSNPAQPVRNQNEITRISKEKDFLKLINLSDLLPEILRLLRNAEFLLAVRRIKQALNVDIMSATERIKYLNQIQILIYKLKNKRFQMKSYLSKDMTYVLNEYQGLDKINKEIYQELLAELSKLVSEQFQQLHFKQEVQRQQCMLIAANCQHYECITDTKKFINAKVMNDLKARLSSNLHHDISNYAEAMPFSQEQLSNIIVILVSKSSDFYFQEKHSQISSNRSGLLDYEVFHTNQAKNVLKCKQKKKIQQKSESISQKILHQPIKNTIVIKKQKEEEIFDAEHIGVEQSIQKYQQFDLLLTPFRINDNGMKKINQNKQKSPLH